MNSLKDLLDTIGVQGGQHVLVHSSFRRLRNAFPGLTIDVLLQELKTHITPSGSLIMPAFSYCFKRIRAPYDIFDRDRSPSRVGAVSDVFWRQPDVIRTSSPTHSFAMWGAVTQAIGFDNAPSSPLGAGSVADWLAKQSDAFILLLGVRFTAMSFCHYIEVKAPVPWHDFSSWEHLGVEKMGASVNGEQPLCEIPGCSQSFLRFEDDLLRRQCIRPIERGELRCYLLPVEHILREGLAFFRNQPDELLCPPGTCQACDSRWDFRRQC